MLLECLSTPRHSPEIVCFMFTMHNAELEASLARVLDGGRSTHTHDPSRTDQACAEWRSPHTVCEQDIFVRDCYMHTCAPCGLCAHICQLNSRGLTIVLSYCKLPREEEEGGMEMAVCLVDLRWFFCSFVGVWQAQPVRPAEQAHQCRNGVQTTMVRS